MSITKSEEAVATRIVRLQGGGLRFLDAHETAETDFQVVTRPHQDNDNQLWRIEDFGGGFVSIQQVSTGRFLEATLGGDFTVVTGTCPADRKLFPPKTETWLLGDYARIA